MSYRDPLCAFCREPPVASCTRCKAPVCVAHAAREDASWCTVCELERGDDLELAVAMAKLSSPSMAEDDGTFAKRGVIAFNLASVVWHAATRPLRIRRARLASNVTFADKSLADIEAWRASNVCPER